jgi:hypothetical protein
MRFRTVRVQSLSNITDRLDERISENQAAGRVTDEVSSYATASALVSMMGRMAAYHYEIESRGVSHDEMIEAVAHIVHQTVTGRRA